MLLFRMLPVSLVRAAHKLVALQTRAHAEKGKSSRAYELSEQTEDDRRESQRGHASEHVQSKRPNLHRRLELRLFRPLNALYVTLVLACHYSRQVAERALQRPTHRLDPNSTRGTRRRPAPKSNTESALLSVLRMHSFVVARVQRSCLNAEELLHQVLHWIPKPRLPPNDSIRLKKTVQRLLAVPKGLAMLTSIE